MGQIYEKLSTKSKTVALEFKRSITSVCDQYEDYLIDDSTPNSSSAATTYCIQPTAPYYQRGGQVIIDEQDQAYENYDEY